MMTPEWAKNGMRDLVEELLTRQSMQLQQDV
jgi:hypothetical protein